MIYSPWGHAVTPTANLSIRDDLENYAKLGFFGSQFQWARNASDFEFDYKSLTYKPYNLNDYEYQNWDTLSDMIRFTVNAAPIINSVEVEPLEFVDAIDLSPSETIAASMYNAEFDVLKKLTNVRFKRPFFYVDSHDGNDVDLPKQYVHVLHSLLTHLLSQHTLIEAKYFGDPLTTNSGMPYSESSYQAKLRSAALFTGVNWNDRALSSVDNLYQSVMPLSCRNRLNELGHKFSMPPSDTLGVIAGRRAGPSRKSGPYYILDDDITQIADIANLPRSRQIFMASYPYNLLVTHTYRRLKSARLQFDPSRHPSSISIFHTKVARIAESSKVMVVEIDASSFDKTVPIALRRALWVHPMLTDSVPDYEMHFARMHDELPYLSPDPFDRGKGGVLERQFKHRAGLYSGIKLTSEIGSYCGLTILAMIGLKSGVLRFNNILDGSWIDIMPVLNLGDDMLLAYPYKTKSDLLRLQTALDEIQDDTGMTFRVALGRRFLMKHLVNNDSYPLYARILQQSIWNEHQRTGDIYTLGCFGRYDGYCESRAYVRSLPDGYWKNNLIRLHNAIDSLFSHVKTHELHEQLRMLSRDKLRLLIVNLSSKLTVDDSNLLIELYSQLQYSTSGRELLNIIDANVDLSDLLKQQSMKEHNLMTVAMKIMGLHPLE